MKEHPWNVKVSTTRNEFRSCYDVTMEVGIPDQHVMNMQINQNMQHDLVDYIASKLHEYLDAEFQQKRLNEPLKKLKGEK